MCRWLRCVMVCSEQLARQQSQGERERTHHCCTCNFENR